GDEAPGVDAALADRRAHRGAQLPPQAIEVLVRQLGGGTLRRDPRLPEDLVGEQVADARDRALIEQARLEGRAAGADAAPELVAPDRGGVRADVAEVRVEHRPAEPAPVS